MKIILEGPDGGGKTTLAKKLIELFDLDYAHMTKRDPMNMLFLNETLKKEDILWDRHFLSEIVYATVYNRETSLDIEYQDILFNTVKKEGIIILICLPETYHIGFNEPAYIKEKHNELVIEYKKLANKYNLPIIDPKKMEMEDICKIIKN